MRIQAVDPERINDWSSWADRLSSRRGARLMLVSPVPVLVPAQAAESFHATVRRGAIGRARKAQVRSAATGIKDVAKRRRGLRRHRLQRAQPSGLRQRADGRKVLRAIVEFGFIRNEAGRHLRAGRSRTIAYLVLDASNPFFTDVAKGVEEVARDTGIAVYLCNSDSDASRRPTTSGCSPSNVYAASSSHRSTRTCRSSIVRRARNPDRPRRSSWRRRLVQRRRRRRRRRTLAVTHLIEQGHRRIAFIGGPLTTVQVADRLRGARPRWKRRVVLPTTSPYCRPTR